MYDQLLNAGIDVPPTFVVVWLANISFIFTNDVRLGLVAVILYVTVSPGKYVALTGDIVFVTVGVPKVKLVSLPICDKFTVVFDSDIPVGTVVVPAFNKLAVKLPHASYWSPYTYEEALSLSHIIIDVLLSANAVLLAALIALPEVLLFCILNSPGEVNVTPVFAYILAFVADVLSVYSFDPDPKLKFPNVLIAVEVLAEFVFSTFTVDPVPAIFSVLAAAANEL